MKLRRIVTRLFGPYFCERIMETKTYTYDWKVAAIHKLRVNIKSLAAEAKIIRREARRAGNFYSWQLTEHRRGRLRQEARITHLALAFVRGRAYRSVEQNSKDMDITFRLRAKVNGFGAAASESQITAWLAGR